MSDQNINISISTTGASEAATDVMQVGSKVEQLGEKSRAGTAPMKNMGMAANAVSYQLQDFAVQVGSGTSAITAFAQQAPQLIGGLSMAGVMTGGLSMAMAGLAVAIPIVLMGGRALYNAMGSGAEESKTKTELLLESVKNVGKMMDEASQREDAATKTRLESLRIQDQQYSALAKAEEAASIAALSNAEKKRQAQNLIIEALGYEIDKYRELQAIAEAEDARIRQTAANQEAELNRGLQKDAAKAMDETRQIGAAAVKQAALERELELEDNRLAALRAQNEQYTRAQKELDSQYYTLQKISALATGDLKGFLTISENQSISNVSAGITGDLRKENEALIKSMETAREKTLKDLLDLREKTASDDEKFQAITADITDKEAAVGQQLETLESNIEGDTNAASAKAAAAQQKQLTDDIAASVATIQAVTPAQQQALADVNKAVSDHKITNDEISALLRNLVTLTGGLQVGTSTTSENVQKLILIMSGYRDEALRQKSQIESLSMKLR